jgi:uncharacterized protein YidB (DUF937 family)
MGILDDLLGRQFGGLAESAMRNPQVIAAVASLLSSRDTSVGGSGGLAGLIQAFQGRGMSDIMSSWISTGPNPPISERQITDVLGADVLSQFAGKAGVPQSQAGALLASLLPAVIDQLTPQGRVPESSELESALGGLLSSVRKQASGVARAKARATPREARSTRCRG